VSSHGRGFLVKSKEEVLYDELARSNIILIYGESLTSLFSHLSNHVLEGSHAAKPCNFPSDPMTLWHGIKTYIGFFPIAVATARTALGRPIIVAI
jgi:hypothetical protein